MKKFELKNVKYMESLSKGTVCFSADYYEDGKLIAHVSNSGQGGGNEVRPAKGKTHKDVAHIDNLDTECEIMDMVIEIDFVKKNQSKKFVLKKDGKLYVAGIPFNSFSRVKKAPDYKWWVEKKSEEFKKDGYEILNTNL